MPIPRNVQARIIASLMQGKVPPRFSLEQLEAMFAAFDGRWQLHLGALLDEMQEPKEVKRLSNILAYISMEMNAEETRFFQEVGKDGAPIPSLGELHLPEIEWVWEHWIPRGMLTVFGAMPSAGKSYVALDIARRIIEGTTFPDGSPVQKCGCVIYVDAENVPQIHNQRATAWEMDRSQLYLMMPSQERLIIDLNSDFDQDRLAEWVWEKQPELVIVDSLSSLTLRGENAIEDVRHVLVFLNRLALDYNCGMMVNHHLRKPGAQLPLPTFLTFHDLRGSSHIAAMGRSIIGLHWVQTGPTQDMNSPRRMEVLKTNLCQYPDAIGVTFEPMADNAEVADIHYGEPAQPYKEPTKREECAAWLVDLLAEQGAMRPSKIIQSAEDLGFSRTTVYEARKFLGDQVIDTQSRQHPHNEWALAELWDEDEHDGEENLQ